MKRFHEEFLYPGPNLHRKPSTNISTLVSGGEILRRANAIIIISSTFFLSDKASQFPFSSLLFAPPPGVELGLLLE